MKKYILIFLLPIMGFNPVTKYEHSTNVHGLRFMEPCKPENVRARTIVENFIGDPDWAAERTETGATGLSLSQIQLLSDDEDDITCEELNMEHWAGIAMKVGSNNDRLYDYTYYKAGNFYFVTVLLAAPSDPNELRTGLSFILIHNQNLNYIKGYSF